MAKIAIRSMPEVVERLLVTDRPIMLTAIKTMKPTMSTIFLENMDLLYCVLRAFCAVSMVELWKIQALISGNDNFP